MKKLYRVMATAPIYVYAEDIIEAETIAKEIF